MFKMTKSVVPLCGLITVCSFSQTPGLVLQEPVTKNDQMCLTAAARAKAKDSWSDHFV